MSVSEYLINPCFLLFLGILLLVVSFVVIYFEGKMREQNHKISSMLSLVYTLAEDLNKFKCTKLSENENEEQEKFHDIQLHNSLEDSNIKLNIMTDNLINVSDNEDDLDDEDDEDEDSGDEDDDDHEVEEEDLEEEADEYVQYKEYITTNNDIKILKIDLNNANKEIFIDLREEDSNTSKNIDLELDIHFLKKTDETSDLNEIVNVDDLNDEIKETDFKQETNNLEENSNDVLDFKKLSIQKLRSIVTEKGLSAEATKLKKYELLKLLGLE